VSYVGGAVVATESKNPFIAELSISIMGRSADGQPKATIRTELVARDSAGRVRFERHKVYESATDKDPIILHSRDGTTYSSTREELGAIITIFDCGGVEQTIIQPGMRAVQVVKGPVGTCERVATLPFRDPDLTLLTAKDLSPHRHIEDLGYREINGIRAHGLKKATFGIEDDGEWNGMVVSEEEVWSSDELEATILRIRKDFKRGGEARFELKEIKQQEPDPALFEIPQGYKENPKLPGDLPYILPEHPAPSQSARQP
jgi:hypothetical protein